MDLVFEEEKQALINTKSKIKELEQERQNILTERLLEKKSGKNVDYDDIQNQATANKRHKRAAIDIDELHKLLEDPYYARIDMKAHESSEIETFYIGKKAIIGNNSSPLVLGWQSDMGDCYARKSETSFEVKGNFYDLHLRRALDISNAQLVGYETEFDRNANQKENELIVDPFLRKMLEKKRYEYEVTDIIKTIQNNQNDIIRSHQSTNFIVQGCAGSGKSMVLLHRLSYLKYNYPQLFKSGVVIITPNDAFIQSIKKLSKELELTTIEKMTIEEYYVKLIKRFFSKTTVQSNVSDESLLPHSLLSVLYSTEYTEQLIASYNEYWDDILNKIKTLNLFSTARKLNINYPQIINYNQSSSYELRSAICMMKKSISDNDEVIKQKSSWINENKAKLKLQNKEIENKHKISLTVNEKKELINLIARRNKLAKEIEIQENLLEQANKNKYSTEERQNIKTALFLMKKLNLKTIKSKILSKSLVELYEAHNQLYLQKKYRHNLYFELLFCYLYHPTASRYDTMLNIDEAQDLAYCEYKLLKDIIKERCTFNVYGDLSQSTFNYRSVNNWDDIATLLSAKIYRLNENYRNSNQITKYCNSQFNSKIIAIGNDFSEVKELAFKEAVAWFNEKKSKTPKYRMAIIFQSKTQFIKQLIKKSTFTSKIALFNVDFNKISVISVEQAKGLEFDAVIVINNGMSENERYIAYTRAIFELIVVKDII